MLEITNKSRPYIEANLVGIEGNFIITSPPNSNYNCHAWGAGIVQHNLDPFDPESPWYGTEENQITLPAMIKRFKDFYGFDPCIPPTNSNFEKGFQKIALFVRNGQVHHTARLLESGSWASKIADEADIEHESLDCFQNIGWGRPEFFLKRSYTGIEPEAEKVSRHLPPNYRILFLAKKLP